MITRETFVSAFADLERRGLGGPGWLRELRQRAIARFAERGLPAPRDEEWKYTPLAPLTATAFDLALDGADPDPSAEAIAPFRIGPSSWSRLVFVNGRFSAKLSDFGALPGRVRLGSLGETLITDPDELRPHLVKPEEPLGPFAALNAAFWQDGAFVQVPDGVWVEDPIHLLFVATTPGRARVEHPRSLIVLGRASRATLIETHAALGGDVYLTNAVAQIALADSARLDRHQVQLDSGRAFHVGRTEVSQAGGSRFTSCSVVFGGRLVRNEVQAVLGAAGADCRLSGLSVVGGRQHVDTHTVLEHAAGGSTSRQLYKGILDGHARGVFSGRVIVRPGANGTDAHQANKNLLLSDEVEVDSKPQLEIFADDVKCSHGAADGQPPAEAIFYLESRGLDEAAARTLLTRGFANEVLDRVGIEPLRAWLDRLLDRRLSGGRVREETA